MKKKILYIAAIIICLSLITGGTYAYFTTSDTARNVITSGGIEVNVVEQQLVNGVLQPYPNQPIQVMPGETVSKIVAVQNMAQPAWIRVSYTVTVLNPEGALMEVPGEELANMVQIQPDAENWTLQDGWWYYTAAVAGGDSTAPLFEQVHFSGPEMGNEYQNCTIVINVNAQAVQKANNGTSALTAAGWPAA